MITFAILITCIFDFRALLIGRFMYGLCVGAYVSVCPLYISELAPPEISGSLGALNNLGAALGTLLGYLLGLLVPLKEDSDAMTSQMWRVVLAAPAIISLLQLCLLTFIFTYETPKFYQNQGDMENYELIMNNIFTPVDLYVKIDDKLTPLVECRSDMETQMTERPTLSPSYENLAISDSYEEESFYDSCKEFVTSFEIETITKEFSSKALVYGCILSAFNQLTGISAVTFYSNELFTQGKQGNEVEWKARIGTMYIGIMSVVGC